jgi:putative DNA primase/helicase
VGIGAACAVASGGAFNSRWIGRGAHRVLFVDGELPLEDVQEKFAVMVRAMKLTAEQEAALLENLRIITPDNQPDLIPDLSTPEGQAAIEPHLDGVALVILDNLSTLCGGAEENDSMAWLPMGGWLLSLRRRNMAAIFVHHAGRNNQARGHSKREDPLDHIIRVQRPPDAAGDSGAHFEVFFTKRRHKFDVKDAQSPFELLLDAGAWALKPLDRAQGERVQELLDLKMSVRDIAAELDMSKSAVQRIKSKGIK